MGIHSALITKQHITVTKAVRGSGVEFIWMNSRSNIDRIIKLLHLLHEVILLKGFPRWIPCSKSYRDSVPIAANVFGVIGTVF